MEQYTIQTSIDRLEQYAQSILPPNPQWKQIKGGKYIDFDSQGTQITIARRAKSEGGSIEHEEEETIHQIDRTGRVTSVEVFDYPQDILIVRQRKEFLQQQPEQVVYKHLFHDHLDQQPELGKTELRPARWELAYTLGKFTKDVPTSVSILMANFSTEDNRTEFSGQFGNEYNLDWKFDSNGNPISGIIAINPTESVIKPDIPTKPKEMLRYYIELQYENVNPKQKENPRPYDEEVHNTARRILSNYFTGDELEDMLKKAQYGYIYRFIKQNENLLSEKKPDQEVEQILLHDLPKECIRLIRMQSRTNADKEKIVFNVQKKPGFLVLTKLYGNVDEEEVIPFGNNIIEKIVANKKVIFQNTPEGLSITCFEIQGSIDNFLWGAVIPQIDMPAFIKAATDPNEALDENTMTIIPNGIVLKQ